MRGFSTDAITALYKHDWPGNVRELINRVRAVVMTEGRLITAQDLGSEYCLDAASPSVADIRKSIEREAIETALLRTRAACRGVGPQLGVSRATLYRWMEAYGIERPRGAEPSD